MQKQAKGSRWLTELDYSSQLNIKVITITVSKMKSDCADRAVQYSSYKCPI